VVAGFIERCRYEPTLDELLQDDVMTTVLRSAGFDAQGFRAMIVETARRIRIQRIDEPTVGVKEHGSGQSN
jgi:hypothetical protein